ncbi:hypothetical protein AXG55_10115 [Silvanigrella aquatica]|uniref:Transposase IS4-like domain-containing protein n=1 Tax=Silvanigrella aquatica TaxID=1915309 RepID=A0A1L4D220_9BACT|nr:hypothetical protein AXG55_10115 [Silvanigrella aquatica]
MNEAPHSFYNSFTGGRITKIHIAADTHPYKIRHLAENSFAILKNFRSIATRYEKISHNFKAII